MRRRQALGLLLMALLALSSACSRRGDATGQDTKGTTARVRLALDWVPEPEFGGFYEARERGGFRSRGLDVGILGGGAGVPVVQMVATGQAEFGTVGGDELVLARARGADVVAIFAVFQTAPQAIMAHASRGFHSLGEVFASGTVALEPGLPYAAFLKRKFGFGSIRVVPYDGGVARFLSDPTYSQQCYATSEPIAAEMRGGDPQVFLLADAGYNPYGTVVITSRWFAEHSTGVVTAFREACAEGWTEYLRDPSRANSLLARLNSSLDHETLARMAARQKPLVEAGSGEKIGIGAMTVERWGALVEQLKGLGTLDRPIEARSLYWSPDESTTAQR